MQKFISIGPRIQPGKRRTNVEGQINADKHFALCIQRMVFNDSPHPKPQVPNVGNYSLKDGQGLLPLYFFYGLFRPIEGIFFL